jgi:hypothetical protein
MLVERGKKSERDNRGRDSIFRITREGLWMEEKYMEGYWWEG